MRPLARIPALSSDPQFSIRSARSFVHHGYLEGGVFVQRFLLHVLAKGLMRIRHYAGDAAPGGAASPADTQRPCYPCPRCRRGVLRVIAMLVPQRLATVSPG